MSVLMLLYGTSAFPIPIRFSPKPAYLSVLEGLPAGAVIDCADLGVSRRNTICQCSDFINAHSWRA